MVDKLKEQLKIKNALLQALEMQIKNSPYNRNNTSVARKKQALLQEIKVLENQLKVQLKD